MKKILLLSSLALWLLLDGCRQFDSVLPTLPQPRKVSNSQAELINSFGSLTGGDGAACSLIFDADEITPTLCRLLQQARKGSEIVFVVDKTSSMSDDIDQVKRDINEIINCLPKGCRLGGAAYGDNRSDGPNWYNSFPLTEDYEQVRAFINGIRVTGGGDIPESVYDALWKVLTEMEWKDCSAPDIIIVMGDAPPKTGSGTDHTADEVVAKAVSICPDTKFYPVLILQL
jgi:von Willebrand factor type A domain